MKSITILKNVKYHVIVIKHYSFLVFATTENKDEKIFKEKESNETLRTLGLINTM